MNEELHTYQAGALLPGLQAFLSGVFFSLVVLGVSLLAGEKQAGIFLLVGGSSCAFLVWLVLLRHWLRLVDFQAGFQPAPKVQVIEPAEHQSSVSIRLFEEQNTYWRGDFLELPATHQQLRLLASGVVSGSSLAENAWCGANKPFSKAQFQELRQALLERGWLQWRNQKAPAQGCEVTHVGRRVFSYLAEHNHLPAGTETW